MDIIKCRTLTHKSKMGFGKYADLTVQDIINLKKISYLRWVYFSLSKINFTDEILDEILIPENYKIEKPGKNEKLNIELSRQILKRMKGLQKHKNMLHLKRVRKAKFVSFEVCDRKEFKKELLWRKNHGH